MARAVCAAIPSFFACEEVRFRRVTVFESARQLLYITHGYFLTAI